MNTTTPDRDVLHAAVALACRAPSAYNTQPWLWHADHTSLHLHADRSRSLRSADPGDRELLLGCGATLHHMVTALAILGWNTAVHRLPSRRDEDHLATIRFTGRRPPGEHDASVLAAIEARTTDRRPYSDRPAPSASLAAMAAVAREHGSEAWIVTGDRRAALTAAFAAAAEIQGRDAAYRAELAAWTARGVHATDGIPDVSTPSSGLRYGDMVMRDFGAPSRMHRRWATPEELGQLVVVGSAADDRMSRLRAGEAVSAVLLTAELHGLAASPLSQALEVPSTRESVRRDVLDGKGFPQLVLRVGFRPPGSLPPLLTPRRPVREVLREVPSRPVEAGAGRVRPPRGGAGVSG
ncbi:hypothetical protein LX15_002227 [Streptoalloteichus tenebrarius]|uniref:NAD(P)H nitroreductase n=1 Tax=Streptoalloteichus tenebrarius (strain ATCC 17920 / DSM 40477 / JCM 4838 / CBS 697.72 / NBRC 16177 / NCIMB 11028 / NRRL B-12390 / A12253. 1 / ISP 5477) TaxID=1933 RepID=A0ABT1HSP3_STRSD|nr:hypothetical protein [Streptoalloteichus tenebrarius]MCP2258529.1 hypothetical protein [Streptoalloteichus tenebrarius]BFF04105.1 NAD(P)H nitroreductase [Streptoalloteichus tenebrarius]